MGCKFISDCTSASCSNLPLVKSPRKNRIETSNAQRVHRMQGCTEYTKENNYRIKKCC